MKLIVGLGNPGLKYEETRHNVGFRAVDKLLRKLTRGIPEWKDEKKFKAEIVQAEWESKLKKNGEKTEKIILVRPKTYMNNSGLAVKMIAGFFKVPIQDIWVIHDELDLPLSILKIRFGGASAGHKGVESIIDALGSDQFWRFRMGIGHPRKNKDISKKTREAKRGAEDFVLSGFEKGESGKVREIIKRTVKALESALEDGMDKAMNKFNSK